MVSKSSKVHTLSDGSTYTVRVVRGLAATEYVVRHSVIPTAGGVLMRLDGPMYLTGMGQKPAALIKIRHPEYEYASTEADGARIALAFFSDSYESTLRHAEEEGIPVRDCYA
jgi:hypothetical protein